MLWVSGIGRLPCAADCQLRLQHKFAELGDIFVGEAGFPYKVFGPLQSGCALAVFYETSRDIVVKTLVIEMMATVPKAGSLPIKTEIVVVYSKKRKKHISESSCSILSGKAVDDKRVILFFKHQFENLLEFFLDSLVVNAAVSRE